MNKKCLGCGALLQSTNLEEVGYVKEEHLENSVLCERCFRIRNYGDYKVVAKNNEEYLRILTEINKTNDLVILVVDVFNINDSLKEIDKILSNPILLVLSKRDILPKSIYEQKILDYLDKYLNNVVDKIFVSSNKNYQLDELVSMIKKYKKTNRVYIVGQSNAGKSTLINKLLYNYSDKDTFITTSMLPSTTLDMIEIEINEELTLIDTPGILEEGNIVNLLTGKELKKVVPNKEMRPITYQIKNKQTILIDDYAVINCLDSTNITLFFSDKLQIQRVFHSVEKRAFQKHCFNVSAGHDIVISGLGFIKVSKDSSFEVFTLENVLVYIRDSLI